MALVHTHARSHPLARLLEPLRAKPKIFDKAELIASAFDMAASNFDKRVGAVRSLELLDLLKMEGNRPSARRVDCIYFEIAGRRLQRD